MDAPYCAAGIAWGALPKAIASKSKKLTVHFAYSVALNSHAERIDRCSRGIAPTTNLGDFGMELSFTPRKSKFYLHFYTSANLQETVQNL